MWRGVIVWTSRLQWVARLVLPQRATGLQVSQTGLTARGVRSARWPAASELADSKG
jgi:hypothetical protein